MEIGTHDAKPVIALAMGDPAGISPELTAKAVGLAEIQVKARLIVVGDRRVFNEGARIAGVKTNIKTVTPAPTVEPHDGEPIFIDLANLDSASISRGVAARQGGQFALENYRYALGLARDGHVDGVCFTPFNKKAMRLARPSYEDEIAYSAEVVGLESSASEFNILEKLWNARVTSHIPLAEVAARLTKERRGLRCCSQLKWPCGGEDWLLQAVPTSASLARRRSAGGVNNESIGSQWPQRRGDGWCVGIGVSHSRPPCRIRSEGRHLGPQR